MQLVSRAIQNDSDFRTLIDIAPVMIWVAGADGQCTFLSRSWRDFTGQDESEGLGTGYLQCIHADDHSSLQTAFFKACQSLEPYQTEYRVRGLSGEYRWVLDSAAPIINPDGSLQGYIGSIVDNHARKAADFARSRIERRLRIALRASEIGTWEWDLSADMFHFSDHAMRIFGIGESIEPITFERLRCLIHPEDIDHVVRLSAAALDPTNRAQEPYRYRILRENDGETRWIEAHGEVIFDQDGQSPSVYIGTFQDITEEVARAQSLRESAARLELALDAAGLAVWELDVTNDRLTPSPALNRLYGFSEDARTTTKDFRSRYAPGEEERLNRLGYEAKQRGENRLRAEVKHMMPDGSVRWLLIQAQEAEPTPEGATRAIGVAMDISDRKLQEEKLAVIAREMEHRVKNTLTLVQVLVDQSFRGSRSVEDGRAIFRERLSAYSRAMDLLAKDNGQAAELSELAKQAVAPFQDRGLQQIQISGQPVQLEPHLAAAIAMGLHELATNAVKYGALSVPEGKVELVWTVQEPWLDLVWRESAGPEVKTPTGRGFGSRLLSGALLQGNAGETSLSFHPTGVEFRLSCNLRRADMPGIGERAPPGSLKSAAISG